jgi:GT2 family glycosyltransferase
MSSVLSIDDTNTRVPNESLTAEDAQEETPDQPLDDNGQTPDQAPPYSTWLARRKLSNGHRQAAIESMSRWISPPRLLVVIVDDNATAAQMQATEESLRTQLFPAHAIEAVSGGWEPMNRLLADSDADWVQIIHTGDRLDELALYLTAERLMADGELHVIYSDEDALTDDGFADPIFRPDINLDLLRSYPYTGRALAFRRGTLLDLGGFRPEYGALAPHDFLLRLIEQVGLPAVGHLDDVIYHAALPFANWLTEAAPFSATALAAHLQRMDVAHRLYPGPFASSHRVEYLHAIQPLVSIVIPVLNQFAQLTVLIDSLLSGTAYPAFELILVDNASDDVATCSYLVGLEQLPGKLVRVLRHGTPCDAATVCNSAISEARGEYLLFLDANSAVLHSDWLDVMVQHAQRPEVGVVGARLHFADGRVQHGGILLGLRGTAEHSFVGEPADAPGYMQRLQVDQNYSAVSSACLMIRKSLFIDVDGFGDEFPETFHAVDLCLKVRQAGFLTVWTPHARLLHDGRSNMLRARRNNIELVYSLLNAEQNALCRRWLPWLARDPAYNRNLSLMTGAFALNEQRHMAWQPFVTPLLPRVLCLPSDSFGCGHYRVRQPLEAMLQEGLIDGMASDRYLVPVEMARFEADVVVLQRQLTDSQRARMNDLKVHSSAFRVYELDDYLSNIPMKSIHRKQMDSDIKKQLRKAVSMVDRFVVSTEPLAEQLGGLHDDIRVVMNRLPTSWWLGLPTGERRAGTKPRVGWGGGSSHTGDLELIADVVRELAGEVEWVFFGMCPDKLRPYVHEFHTGVHIDEYPAKLASLNLDLALAPLEDNIFNACKSNLRLLEYGACGFPVICSDIICYRSDLPVTRVKNRFRDWTNAIRMHLSDMDATAAAGDALRDAVRRDWMLTGQHLVDWRKAWLPD